MKLKRLLLNILFVLCCTLLFEAENSKTVWAGESEVYAYLLGGTKDSLRTNSLTIMKNMIERNTLFTKRHIKRAYYDGEGRGTTEGIVNTQVSNFFGNSDYSNTCIFYYSGHGNKEGFSLSPNTYESWYTLASSLASVKCSKMIVFIDSCHSGAFISEGLNKLLPSRRSRFVVLTSAEGNEYSYKKENIYTRFSSWVSEGVGIYDGVVYADYNNDNKITVQELINYLRNPIRNGMKYLTSEQHPMVKASNMNTVLFRYKSSQPYLEIDCNSMTIKVGESKKIGSIKRGSGTIRWFSSNSYVASVDSNGKVTGYKKGNTVITAYCQGLYKRCNVRVETNEKSPVLSSGYYTIQTAANSNMVLDIYNNSIDNNANLEIYTKNGGTNQIFYVDSSTYRMYGYYTIRALHSNKMIDVAGASSKPNTNVIQYARNGGKNQKWDIISAGDGSYYIKSMLGTYLDNSGGNLQNGNNVITYSFNGGINQKWRFVKTSKPALQVDISNYNYPVFRNRRGCSFSVKGTVESNYPITQLTCYVGGTSVGFKYTKAAVKISFNRPLNKFGNLKRGYYYYIVKVTTSEGSKTVLKKGFTVY